MCHQHLVCRNVSKLLCTEQPHSLTHTHTTKISISEVQNAKPTLAFTESQLSHPGKPHILILCEAFPSHYLQSHLVYQQVGLATHPCLAPTV